MDTASPGNTVVAKLLWATLTAFEYINPKFSTVLSSESVILALLHTARMVISDGVLSALQASTPPAIDFFKSLPDAYIKGWGIYCLVLDKPNHPPSLYLGSATSASSGLRLRIKQYSSKCAQLNMPQHVQRLRADGYQITHSRRLMNLDIPSPELIPKLRVLYVALEAAFTFGFGVLHNRTKNYGARLPLCPWSLASLDYFGLCSHNPLIEHVEGDLELSKEEVQCIAKQKKERRKGDFARYRNSDKGQRKAKASQDQRTKDGINKNRMNMIKAEKRFYCSRCQVASDSQSAFDGHNAGNKHKKKMELLFEYCEDCRVATPNLSAYKMHIATKGHLKRVTLLA